MQTRDQAFLGTEPVGRLLMRLAIPTVIAQLVNMLYNIVDRIYIGHIVGIGSLALTGVGVCMPIIMIVTAFAALVASGSAPRASIAMGRGDRDTAEKLLGGSFSLQIAISLTLTAVLLLFGHEFLLAFGASENTIEYADNYLNIYAFGTLFVELTLGMNAFITAQGFATTGMMTVLIGAVCNIVLDPIFIFGLNMGVRGAALATVIAQGLSAAGIALYFFFRLPELRPRRSNFRLDRPLLSRIASVSVLTSVQQSIMNFGILLVQSLVNSFGVATMAAFAAGVKIDSFAYSPAQDFANGFATFVAQNTGAGKPERVKQGIREAALLSLSFCAVVSALVFLFARPLLTLFIDPGEREILAVGVHYLRVEGVFYVGIGLLFLLYAIYRGLERAGMSVVLTVISLGTRVVLAYLLAGPVGEIGIWIAIPIGWVLADLTGYGYYFRHKQKLLPQEQK